MLNEVMICFSLIIKLSVGIWARDGVGYLLMKYTSFSQLVLKEKAGNVNCVLELVYQ